MSILQLSNKGEVYIGTHHLLLLKNSTRLKIKTTISCQVMIMKRMASVLEWLIV